MIRIEQGEPPFRLRQGQRNAGQSSTAADIKHTRAPYMR